MAEYGIIQNNMNRLFVFILLSIGHGSVGQTNTSFGNPIFWYHVSDPWAMFMGAEGPPFILYDNGKILFWKRDSYFMSQLDKEERIELISEINLFDTLFHKSRFYNATNREPNG